LGRNKVGVLVALIKTDKLSINPLVATLKDKYVILAKQMNP